MLRSQLRRRAGILVASLAGFCMGVLSQSRENPLPKLAKQTETVSSSDWLLLRTRVQVLEQALKDDLSLPLAVTDLVYDRGQQRMKFVVSVNGVWLAKTGLDIAANAFRNRASSLCVQPVLVDPVDMISIGFS